ncbi:MAG: ATP-NAD kinase family protein [Clostridiaceae bacterium]
MTSIGIIANPASGKDIRRLLSHATTVDNHEKVNIIERIVLGAQAHGVEKVYVMPDSYKMGYQVVEKLNLCDELKCNMHIIDMPHFGGMEDTINAAKIMEKNNVGCIVTLGGDGTNRAVAKAIINTPVIAISTGTNNVYPTMMEGTIAGIAASVVASGRFDNKLFISRDKRIEIYEDDCLKDIALVDAVISKDAHIGSKAIWDMKRIDKIFVTRSHPASIGFSSILGCKKIVFTYDDFGAFINVNTNGTLISAPISAGVVDKISVDEPVLLRLNEKYEFIAKSKGTIALDGEREIAFSENQIFNFTITRNGPYRVNVTKALEVAQLNGFFEEK